MQHIEKFKFSINQKVKILDIDRPARICALIVNIFGRQYQCIYWNDGQRISEWICEDEIDEL